MECGSGQYITFSACVCMQSHLTAFSINSRGLFTALAVQRTSQSHLETKERLGPIPLATQLQESKRCLDGSFTSGSSCSNLLATGAGKEHSKGSFHAPLEGWQKIFPSKEKHDNFQLQTFSVSYLSCLAANEAEARISSSDLRWWHISMAAD